MAAMSPRKRAPASKPAYHHGDLRRAVLDASLALLGEAGIEALSLREVARRAGVTHAAPYHHFHDKAGLLDALAEEGFACLRDAMLEASLEVKRPGARLAAIGRAYVVYAVSHPAHFTVMFRPGRGQALARGLASREAYQVLVDQVVGCQRAGLAPAGDSEALVLFAWSVVHGLASLSVDGALATPARRPDPEAAGARIAELLASLFAAGGRARRRKRPARQGVLPGQAQSRQGYLDSD